MLPKIDTNSKATQPLQHDKSTKSTVLVQSLSNSLERSTTSFLYLTKPLPLYQSSRAHTLLTQRDLQNMVRGYDSQDTAPLFDPSLLVLLPNQNVMREMHAATSLTSLLDSINGITKLVAKQVEAVDQGAETEEEE